MNILNNIDWHATDRCNLRCVSCGHFCPLVNYLSNETDRTIEDAQKDFESLYQATENGKYINRLMITGGECTLNKNLPSIIELAEKYFPNKVQLWSNAINLNLYTQELIDIIHKYNIQVNITLYHKHRENIIRNFFIKNNISFFIYKKTFTNDSLQFFDKFFTIEEIEENKDILYCESKFNCCQLKNQRLYVCQYAAYLDYLDNKEVLDSIGYNDSKLYIELNNVKSYQEISDFIEYYNEPICNHCLDQWMTQDFSNRINQRVQLWKVSNKNIDEWIIDKVENL